MNQKRRTVGTDPLDPLDSILSPKAGKAAPEPKERAATPKRATFHLNPDLLEALKDAAVYFAGPPERATLSSIVSGAIEAELLRLRKKHLGGAEIPKRESDPRPGRPVR